jgi:hypothetical protein
VQQEEEKQQIEITHTERGMVTAASLLDRLTANEGMGKGAKENAKKGSGKDEKAAWERRRQVRLKGCTEHQKRSRIFKSAEGRTQQGVTSTQDIQL